MIQQFRNFLRLQTAANQSEGREMIGYADYYFHWLLYGLQYHSICDHFFAVVFARISMSFQEKSFFLQTVYWKKCKLDP